MCVNPYIKYKEKGVYHMDNSDKCVGFSALLYLSSGTNNAVLMKRCNVHFPRYIALMSDRMMRLC